MNVDELTHDYALEMRMTHEEIIDFLGTRNSCETAIELLGVDPFESYYKDARHSMSSVYAILNEFQTWMRQRGYYLQLRDPGVSCYVPAQIPEWPNECVDEFDHMWNSGFAIVDISRSFRKHPVEVIHLANERVKYGCIEPRRGGISGHRIGA